MKRTKTGILLGIAFSATLVIAVTNYLTLQRLMSQVRSADSRNSDISVFVHYKYFIDFNVLVYDLRDVPRTASPLDVTRVLLQYAEKKKGQSFDRVELSYRGDARFILQGQFFHQLGQEYETQNPMYTVRTLPQNLYRPDGSPAFGTWSGGILGVLGKQMEDFRAWHRAWYIDDIASASNAALK